MKDGRVVVVKLPFASRCGGNCVIMLCVSSCGFPTLCCHSTEARYDIVAAMWWDRRKQVRLVCSTFTEWVIFLGAAKPTYGRTIPLSYPLL